MQNQIEKNASVDDAETKIKEKINDLELIVMHFVLM